MTSAQDPGPRLERGQRVGRYEVSSLLGVGGMGEVYRALDLEVNREVALKVLPAHLHLDAERQARFEREARLLGALRHPGIARLYEVGEHHGLRFLAMELVEGESFADTLRSRGARRQGACPRPVCATGRSSRNGPQEWNHPPRCQSRRICGSRRRTTASNCSTSASPKPAAASPVTRCSRTRRPAPSVTRRLPPECWSAPLPT